MKTLGYCESIAKVSLALIKLKLKI
jgi:hypothetical protein